MVLNDGQYRIYKEALEWFKSRSSPQVFEIDGLAGTGKSVLISAILRGLNLKQSQYMPMAYTGQASIVMRSKGFPNAKSIHSSLYEVIEFNDSKDIDEVFHTPKHRRKFVKKQQIDPNVQLFFIDEAYMVPDYMMRDILSFGVKVIACGDQHQLPPIGGNPAFLTGPNVHHLTELMRQSANDPIVYLANRAINGEPIHRGLYGNVLVINDTELEPYMFAPAEIVICALNRTRAKFNEYVRTTLGINTPFPQFNERLICRNNNWNIEKNGIALANGLIGNCMRPPTPDRMDSNTFMIDFRTDINGVYFDDVEVNMEYFFGDQSKRDEIRNKNRRWFPGDFFEFAYAISTHLSQGAEFDNGIYIEEQTFNRKDLNQLLYTGITRFKKGLLYVKKTGYDLQLPQRRIL